MSSAPRAVLPAVNGWNADFLESQFNRWKSDPRSVGPDLQSFFQGFELAHAGITAGRFAQAVGGAALLAPLPAAAPAAPADSLRWQLAGLIAAYRTWAHLGARIDPFGRERQRPAALDPAAHGFTEADLDRPLSAGPLSDDGAPLPLREIIARLERTYCGSVGFEFTHIADQEQVRWLIDRLEGPSSRRPLTTAARKRLLEQLHKAELFERFCGKRYPGDKRFSLEGGESLIPMLDAIIETAGEQGVEEIVMGMAHRGRLTVLTNIVGKTYEQIFTEFEDTWTEDFASGGGDVKYHGGYSCHRILSSGKKIWIVMASNPSHLEAVNPVVEGRVRVKQRLLGDVERKRVVPLLIHGDAAVIGQGVVAETLNLARLEGYTTGGTVHIVTNNLIGFTTGPEDGRSYRYCTDVAKALEVPVLHVNGEDPEAVLRVSLLATEYRMRFKQDVAIDLLCYRRHGHNEMDEAAFTQPLLYAEIKNKPSVLKTYAERLLAEGLITESEMETIRRSLDENLDRAYSAVQAAPVAPSLDPGHQRWEGVTDEFSFDAVDTTVPRERLAEIAHAMGRWPEGFTPHPKLVKILRDRARCVDDDLPLDWGTAENLAVGSLLLDGIVVRLAGQDSRRGTFSHRHAALRDVNTGDLFVPLSHIRDKLGAQHIKRFGDTGPQAKALESKYWVYDSPLSEFACMGFEYGWSLGAPNCLAMWEAQFGDFCNGAQIVIDLFIASGEVKWQRWSGLVLLLPHGSEGLGPEHTSARMERFLQLCADNNMQVCYPTTPAQHFHMLRRQVKRSFRKPLIVMTPKSLLRLPAASSRVADLTKGMFVEILDDPAFASAPKKDVRRVILCTGKIYYELAARREALKRQDLALVRVEQLYPLRLDTIKSIVESYPRGVELAWVQEEPKNMGAWSHMFINFQESFGWELPCISPAPNPSPASGSHTRNHEQQEEILVDAIGPFPVEAEKPAAAH